MKKISVLLSTIMLLCLVAGFACANTLSKDTDVFKTTADGKMTITDVLIEGTEYEQIDSLTSVNGSAFDTYYYTSAPIEWAKIAYIDHGGIRQEGWIVLNPNVITGINMSAFDTDDDSMSTLPPDGFNGNSSSERGFVLCETLSLRESPSTVSAVLTTLPYGSWCEIIAKQDVWFNVVYVDTNGIRYQGWVKGEYVLVNPAYFHAGVETAVYAFPATDAKRVGLLDAGASHPIIGELNDFWIISLRGACGFVEKP